MLALLQTFEAFHMAAIRASKKAALGANQNHCAQSDALPHRAGHAGLLVGPADAEDQPVGALGGNGTKILIPQKLDI